jgi:hypothetical protein
MPPPPPCRRPPHHRRCRGAPSHLPRGALHPLEMAQPRRAPPMSVPASRRSAGGSGAPALPPRHRRAPLRLPAAALRPPRTRLLPPMPWYALLRFLRTCHPHLRIQLVSLYARVLACTQLNSSGGSSMKDSVHHGTSRVPVSMCFSS